jgi:hypothetical protein
LFFKVYGFFGLFAVFLAFLAFWFFGLFLFFGFLAFWFRPDDFEDDSKGLGRSRAPLEAGLSLLVLGPANQGILTGKAQYT